MATTPDGNLFAPPEAQIGEKARDLDLARESGAGPARLDHLRQETAIRSLGLFCHLHGFFGLVNMLRSALALAFLGKVEVPPGQSQGELQSRLILGSVVCIVVAMASVSLGHGLRTFRAWARWTGLLLCGIFILLMVLALGMTATRKDVSPLSRMLWIVSLPISVWVFQVLGSPMSGRVFSAEYRRVVARTPEIRGQAHPLVKVVVGLISALLVLWLMSYVAKFCL